VHKAYETGNTERVNRRGQEFPGLSTPDPRCGDCHQKKGQGNANEAFSVHLNGLQSMGLEDGLLVYGRAGQE
jgi:hypothetical protein